MTSSVKFSLSGTTTASEVDMMQATSSTSTNRKRKNINNNNHVETSASLAASDKDSAGNWLLKVPFPWVSMITLVMPLFAFVYCIVYSFFYHYEWTTQTHCNVWNFAPSISAAIGLFRPQKYVWKMLLSLHSAPRLLLALMYRNYLKTGLGPKYRVHAEVAFMCNVVEVLSLLMLSFAPSREDFRMHKNSFACFLTASIIYMLLTFWLYAKKWTAKRSASEDRGYSLKKTIIKSNAVCISAALYLYYRHNKYCEPGMYSIFSIFEYGVVLSNMGYHWTSYYDFHERYLQV